MAPRELGFDTNYTFLAGFLPTRTTPNPAYFTFDNHRYLLKANLFHQSVIVSRGTLCWLAESESGVECVIKDSWRAAWRASEGNLLTMAGERGVWGLPRRIAHGDVRLVGDRVDSISELRAQLEYHAAICITLSEGDTDGLYILSSALPSQPAASISGTVKSSGRKWRAGKQLGSDRLKPATRGRGSQRAHLSSTAGQSSSRRGVTTRISTSGRQNAVATLAANTPLTGTTEVSGRASQVWRAGGRYLNLIHSVIISTPVGTKIEDFRSIKELLEAMRDAIKCMYGTLGLYLHLRLVSTDFNCTFC